MKAGCLKGALPTFAESPACMPAGENCTSIPPPYDECCFTNGDTRK